MYIHQKQINVSKMSRLMTFNLKIRSQRLEKQGIKFHLTQDQFLQRIHPPA